MKKTFYLFAVTMLLTIAASTSSAAAATGDPVTKEAAAAMTPEQRQARIDEIKQRIDEIRAMDRSQLTRPERKELRAELKSLKHQATIYDVLYIGVGALVILVIILLILL